MVSPERTWRAIRDLPRPTAWELWEIGIQLALLPLTVVPRAVGLRACALFAAALMRPGSGYRRKVEAQLPPALTRAFDGSVGRTLRSSETYLLYDRVLVLRGVLFPWRRRRLRVLGLTHLNQALDAGHGAILWVQPCVSSSICVKQAIEEAGHPLAHLTRPSHGFSGSPFGIRLVNPLLRRAETRFLAERIVIDEGHTVGAIRRIRTVLKENRVVSITVTNTATHLDEFPFLDGTLILPSGPVELAALSGAALLPVFTAGTHPIATVEIGAPLPISGADQKSVRESQEAMVAWLEGQIAEHPLDWIGWRASLYRR
ncbi:MAG TPA: hypothetical protein VFK32_04705 [Tepidiformaceae bacterium]|nr:hypothetical protein [Tepidiformaceae bacterium]